MATIHCDIVSAEQDIFSGALQSITAMGAMGELGIQRGHAPLLTPLKPGPLRLIKEDGEEELVFVSGGYMEVQAHVVTVLADTAVRAHDIDEAAAEQARQAAEKALTDQSGEFDYSKAAAELAEASAQLLTLQKLRKKLQ